MANKKRLIYVEDAKEALTGWETDPTDEEIEYTLDNLPTVDAVEVVRCKDCKHYNASVNSCFNRQWDMESATEVPFVCEDDFCSYGERREGE